MAVVEYKFIFVQNIGGTTPSSIKNGGYMLNGHDNTLIGWSDEILSYEVQNAKIRVLTKSDLANRQLSIHQKTPIFWPEPYSSLETYEEKEKIVMTEQEVIDDAYSWYDAFVDENCKPSTNVEELNLHKNNIISRAFAKMESKIENSVVDILIESQNDTCPFGCDKITQENIIGINVAIARNINVSNPTLWTPKGYFSPVEVTHDELATIGGQILNKKNDMYNVYFIHKSNIMSINNSFDLEKYDYSTGY